MGLEEMFLDYLRVGGSSGFVGEEFISWLTGFWEGDGSIERDGTVVFAQKYTEILVGIQKVLECGSLYSYPKTGLNHLVFKGRCGRRLILLLADRLVCPGRVDQMKRVLEPSGLDSSIGEHSPTRDWFVGFWDAEGYSSVRKQNLSSTFVGVSQKDRVPLDKIRNFWGCGSVYKGRQADIFGWTLSLREDVQECYKEVICLLLQRSRNPQKRQSLVAHLGESYNSALFREDLIRRTEGVYSRRPILIPKREIFEELLDRSVFFII